MPEIGVLMDTSVNTRRESNWHPSTCPECRSSAVMRVIVGLPTPELFDDPTVVLVGCVPPVSPMPEWHCGSCNHEWTQDLWLNLDEEVTTTVGTVRVSESDLAWLPLIRQRLIASANLEETITYPRLEHDIGLPHAAASVVRLMDLISIDCERRDEPALAAIAVRSATDEIGASKDVEAERDEVFAMWSRLPHEARDHDE